MSVLRGSGSDPDARPGILFLVQNLAVPFDRRVWQESKSLRSAGYDVHVICPKSDESPLGYEHLEGVHIYRYSPGREAGSLSGYVLEYSAALYGHIRLALSVARRSRIDVVHACTTGFPFRCRANRKDDFGVKFRLRPS